VFFLQWWQQPAYPLIVWLVLGLLGFVGFFLGLFLKSKVGTLMIASVMGIALACMAVAHTTHSVSTGAIDFYAHGKSVTITGTISDAPDDRQTFINYTVDTTHIRTSKTGSLLPIHGKVLVTDREHWPRYAYGDTVIITGILDHPKKTDTFAYDNYLSRFGIYATMRATAIHLESSDHGNPIIAGLIHLREQFEAQINRVYPEPHASFLAGLLTGSRRGMPDHLTQAFKKTGLTHIVAISGFNITIIIAIISGCLFFLPLKWRFLPTILAIILFTLFVGASASVVRASIMGILGLLALQTGRMRDARLAILWTACVMLLWNPKMLWYDAGFQLSFLAVIGLLETAPYLERWMQRVPQTLGLREALTLTIAAQMFAVPWVIAQFGLLSLISPVANILVAPLIPPAMLFGFLGTTISFVLFPLGQMIAFLGWGCMALILLITETLASLPFAAVQIPSISIFIICLYYIVLISGLVVLHRTRNISPHIHKH
jgi:competence protein ComEC